MKDNKNSSDSLDGSTKNTGELKDDGARDLEEALKKENKFKSFFVGIGNGIKNSKIGKGIGNGIAKGWSVIKKPFTKEKAVSNEYPDQNPNVADQQPKAEEESRLKKIGKGLGNALLGKGTMEDLSAKDKYGKTDKKKVAKGIAKSVLMIGLMVAAAVIAGPLIAGALAGIGVTGVGAAVVGFGGAVVGANLVGRAVNKGISKDGKGRSEDRVQNAKKLLDKKPEQLKAQSAEKSKSAKKSLGIGAVAMVVGLIAAATLPIALPIGLLVAGAFGVKAYKENKEATASNKAAMLKDPNGVENAKKEAQKNKKLGMILPLVGIGAAVIMPVLWPIAILGALAGGAKYMEGRSQEKDVKAVEEIKTQVGLSETDKAIKLGLIKEKDREIAQSVFPQTPAQENAQAATATNQQVPAQASVQEPTKPEIKFKNFMAKISDNDFQLLQSQAKGSVKFTNQEALDQAVEQSKAVAQSKVAGEQQRQ